MSCVAQARSRRAARRLHAEAATLATSPRRSACGVPPRGHVAPPSTPRAAQFGVKVSVATTVKHSAGGQFVTHVAVLPGNPYDGHTLATVIPQMEALIGNLLERCITDAGYRGHNAPPDHKFKNLHRRPEAPGHAADQARVQTASRDRARDRPPQARTPDGPQLSRPCQRRCHQRCSPPPATTSAASSEVDRKRI
jgi:IS5 family transposase